MGFGAQLDAIIREIPDLTPRSKVVDSPGVPKIGTQQFWQAIGVNATRNLSRSLLHENDSPPPKEEVVRGWWHGAQSPLALLVTEGNCVVFMEGGEPRSMRSSIQMLHRRWPVYSHEPYHFELLTCANTPERNRPTCAVGRRWTCLDCLASRHPRPSLEQ